MESLQSTLMTYLNQVPDFRHARGQRFAWPYLLALLAAAVAAGQWSVLTMAAWARDHRVELLAVLQSACPRLPSTATWRRLLEYIDLAALEQQVAAYNQMLDAADLTTGQVVLRTGEISRGQAIDGKDVRGASTHGQHTFLISLVGTKVPTSWAKPLSTSKPTISPPCQPCWRAEI